MTTVLLTRPIDDAGTSKRRLELMGHEVLVAPMMRIMPVTFAVPDQTESLIVTSANAVRHGLRNLDDRNWTVYCVGEATAEAAKAEGFSKLVVGPGTARGLMPLLLDSSGSVKRKFTHMAGEEISYDIAGALRQNGFEAKATTVYQAAPSTSVPFDVEAALNAGVISHVLFYSPRTATIFEELVADQDKHEWLHRLSALCISTRVAEMLIGPWRTIKAGILPSEQAMFKHLPAIADPDGPDGQEGISGQQSQAETPDMG